ncbi:cation:proton antiporter [Williamsia soli]|uniref:cation:proton antiporter n=1 Tax=Williamsia soli TaxID=364929 RepID=UPI001AA00452|nr:cation:proton antiporter [Williamsia soli]
MSATVVTSLFWITVIAVLAPLVAGLIRKRRIPEVVLLLVGGIIIGPHALDIAVEGPEIQLLRELGLGMLFLLAGYEIKTSELVGREGRRALYTWICCLALAFAVTFAIGTTGLISAESAVAIAMCSTALGTLLPILRDSGMLEGRLGLTVLNHGAFGELGPVIAMAVLLSARGSLKSAIVLVIFAVAAVVVWLISEHLVARHHWLTRVVSAGSDTTAQTSVRITVLLLVGLMALAYAFDLDTILGAFAAGFILRRMLPDGDESIEIKLDGIAFGLLIPIFFITSGMAIDISAVAAEPWVLVVFVAMILLVRGVPVFVAARWDRGNSGAGPPFDLRERVQLGLYSATGLPIIVAVTGVAVASGDMSAGNASVLVTAGAVTVLVLPLAASIVGARGKKSVAPAPASAEGDPPDQ